MSSAGYSRAKVLDRDLPGGGGDSMNGLKGGDCSLRLSSVPRCAGLFFLVPTALLPASSAAVQLGAQKWTKCRRSILFLSRSKNWGPVRVRSAATGHVAAHKGVTYVQ